MFVLCHWYQLVPWYHGTRVPWSGIPGTMEYVYHGTWYTCTKNWYHGTGCTQHVYVGTYVRTSKILKHDHHVRTYVRTYTCTMVVGFICHFVPRVPHNEAHALPWYTCTHVRTYVRTCVRTYTCTYMWSPYHWYHGTSTMVPW